MNVIPGVRNAYEAVLKFAAHDPLIAVGLALIALLIFPLGVMHLFRIFGGFILVLVREFKAQFLGIAKVFRQVKQEASSWKVDEINGRTKAGRRANRRVTRMYRREQ
jgi:hypothetical protein